MGGFSIWQGLGLVVGAVAGFFTGGAGWALAGSILMGASVGYAIGSAIDPQTPDIPQPGEPALSALDFPTAEEGGVIYDFLGTTKLAGNLLWYGGARTVEVTETQEVSEGKGGSNTTTQTVTTGYKYYLSWALGLGLGPCDELLTVLRGDEVVWEGNLLLTDYASQGYASITLTNIGTCYFFFGTDNQPKMSTMNTALTTALNPSYRHLIYAFMDDCFIGNYNRAPVLRFVCRKTPAFSWSPKERIGLFDYNPFHACYYVIQTLAGLPTTWIDEDAIANAASEIAGVTEGHGVSMLFSAQRSAQTYLETILSHVNGIMRYSNESKFIFELMRATTAASDLLSIDDDDFLEEPMVARKTWLDCVSDVKVQHHIRTVEGRADIFSFAFPDEAYNNYPPYTYDGPIQGYTIGDRFGDQSPNFAWDRDYTALQATKKPGQLGDSRWHGYCGHLRRTGEGLYAIFPSGYSSSDMAQWGVNYFIVGYSSPTGYEARDRLIADIAEHGWRPGSWFVFSRDVTGSNDSTMLANSAAQVANVKAYLAATYAGQYSVYDQDENATDERFIGWLLRNVLA